MTRFLRLATLFSAAVAGLMFAAPAALARPYVPSESDNRGSLPQHTQHIARHIASVGMPTWQIALIGAAAALVVVLAVLALAMSHGRRTRAARLARS